ncbi:MAG TPA: hypothetical protein PKV05_00745 [Bacillota bacterium]|nr:hypothetical protein [Bacillota bacterium]
MAIIWALIQAFSQPPKKTPARRQSPRTLSHVLQELQQETAGQSPALPQEAPPLPSEATPQPAVAPEAAQIMLPPEEEETGPAWLTADTLLQGVIMAEILGPPRARRRCRK